MNEREQRWLAVAGLVFVLVVVVAVVSTPNLDSTASAAKVVASATNHKSTWRFSGLVTLVAVFEGIFFFWYLREYVATVAANRRLATIGFAGAILFATSGLVSAGIKFSIADGVGHLDPNSMQVLNVLQNDLSFALGGIGVALLLVGTGVATIRRGPLPAWLGWVGVVLGVLGAVAGPPAAGLWILIASIVILARAGHPSSTRAAAP